MSVGPCHFAADHLPDASSYTKNKTKTPHYGLGQSFPNQAIYKVATPMFWGRISILK